MVLQGMAEAATSISSTAFSGIKIGLFVMADLPLSLLLLALVAIGVLVVLVTWRKLNAFVAALLVGIRAGMAPLATLKAF